MMTKEQIISEHYADLGHRGGTTNKKRYGRDYFVRIGRLGGFAKQAVDRLKNTSK